MVYVQVRPSPELFQLSAMPGVGDRSLGERLVISSYSMFHVSNDDTLTPT